MNDSNVIFSYTREDAINDGTFIDVSEVAKEAGLKYPVAITSNLYNTHIIPTENQKAQGQDEQGRLWDTLWMLIVAIKTGKSNGNMTEYEVLYSGKKIKIWAVCEATSPDDPSPAINIMLPSDY